MSDNYPRVLIVNHQSIYADNATGITLRSLWNGWPQDDVLELCSDSYSKRMSSELSIPSICIPPNAVSRLAHSRVAEKANQDMKTQSGKSKLSLRGKIRQAAVLAIDILPSKITKEIVDKIDDFEPEVIYTLGASVSCLRNVYFFHKRYSIPIIIHYMDNWVEHLQWDDNELIKPYKYLLSKKLNKCMVYSPISFTISESMSKEYSRLFPKTRFMPLMNSVNCKELLCSDIKKDHLNTFVYTGGLHLDRWKGLVDIGKALKECDPDSVLRIYTSSNIDAFKMNFDDLPVEFYPSVSHDSIKDVFESADCLVHTEVDNDLLSGFFRYSISTKIPEYLSSGRIMLFYGPRNIGLYEYLMSNNVALVCSDYDELKSQIRYLLSEKNLVRDITRRAIEFANKQHSSEMAQKVLLNGIEDCVGQQSE